MSLDSKAFMEKMEKRISFTDADKSLLKDGADWGKQIAPGMVNHFYAYLGCDLEMEASIDVEKIRRLISTI
jgi:hypothetical protein